MITIIIYTIISFILDGLLSNYIEQDSLFITIYSLIALVISYNYFDNDKKYLKVLITLAILFDIVYTNTFIINILIFK